MTPEEAWEKELREFLAEVDRDLRRLDMQMWWMTALVGSSLVIFFAVVLLR